MELYAIRKNGNIILTVPRYKVAQEMMKKETNLCFENSESADLQLELWDSEIYHDQISFIESQPKETLLVRGVFSNRSENSQLSINRMNQIISNQQGSGKWKRLQS